MATKEEMQRIADEIRERWERSLVGEETPAEREERCELTRRWYALRGEVRCRRCAAEEARQHRVR